MTRLINNESFLIKILSTLILIMPYSIRASFYGKFGYTKSAFNDSDWIFRLRAYLSLGCSERAFKDDSASIRRHAYSKLGYTKNAFKDSDDGIRYRAYKELGFTKEALEDDDFFIQKNAYLHFGFIKDCFEMSNYEDYKFKLNSFSGASSSVLLSEDFCFHFEEIRKLKEEYFEKCRIILGCDEIKYNFTEEEAALLRMNNVPVNDLAILNDKEVYDKIN